MISMLEMHEDMLFPWRGECDSDQCILGSLVVMMLPWLASERPGFDSPLRHRIFFGSLLVTYSTHCYSTF